MSVNLAPSANSTNSPLTNRTAGLGNGVNVKKTLGIVYGVTGYSTTAQFLQIHDKATAASNAEVPLVTIPIAAGAAFNLDFGVYGLLCTNGIQVVNSITGPTLTIGAADTFMTIRYA